MSIEHKRKAEDAGDSGPDAKSQRDSETQLGREAQAVLDDKIAEGTVCDRGTWPCLLCSASTQDLR